MYIYIYIYREREKDNSIYDIWNKQALVDLLFSCICLLYHRCIVVSLNVSLLFGGEPTTTHESQKTTGKFRIRVLLRLTEGPKANPSTLPRGTLHLTSGTNLYVYIYI